MLTTYRRDSGLQSSPISAGVVAGRVVISTRASLAKVRNLERNPNGSLVVFTDKFFGSWVQVDGTVKIVRQPEALDLLEATYRSIAGEHPDWADYRAAMIRDERVVLIIEVSRAAGRIP